jgi:thiamine kinase
MNPTDIAAETLRKHRDAFAPPQKIDGGLTNDSWLVRADDTAIVVRLGNHNTEALQIDRQSEAAVLNAVARAGIGPPVLVCAPDRHLLITQHLAGHRWTAREARLKENVTRVALRLRELHALPIPEGVQKIDLRAIVTAYWNTLLAHAKAARAGPVRTRSRALKLIAELASDATLCLCHNDVHHLNVIDDGKLWLVDWEYSGIGDPYFDLASVCCYHAYSDAQRKQLLSDYFGLYRPAALDRLHRMCWVFNYIRELWFAAREMEDKVEGRR